MSAAEACIITITEDDLRRIIREELAARAPTPAPETCGVKRCRCQWEPGDSPCPIHCTEACCTAGEGVKS